VKRVYSSFNRVAVHHARNLLETEGIRAVVRNEFLSSAMGELPPAECQMEVWVLQDEDSERADRVLKSSFSPKTGPPWKCSSCGESGEVQFTQCWRCGAYRAA
jgi:Putative prokaryotic signal transducing protein